MEKLSIRLFNLKLTSMLDVLFQVHFEQLTQPRFHPDPCSPKHKVASINKQQKK